MVGPDGPEQRQSELDEFFYDELERCDIAEQLGAEAVDEAMAEKT